MINLPTILSQILAMVALAFTITIFIVGIAHDTQLPKFGKIMMIIMLGVIFAVVSSLF